MTNSHSTKHSREFIINTMYMDFGEKIDDEVIEASKEVAVFHEHSETPIFECPSITAAAKKLKLSREHVRDCLNPNKPRKTAGGFKFMFQKPWEEQKAFNKAKELKKIPTITAHTSYKEMIAIAKEDIKRNYK